MPSQFFGLTIGYSGLVTYQAAINTTGNNIANVNTKGYSKQTVTQVASKALRTNTSYGMAGSGVTATSIDQLRNTYYDIKYRNNSTNLGEHTVKADYMKQIENYFNDDGKTIKGFNTIYTTEFYNALENLQNNPGSTAVRSSFVGAAQSLAEYFNTMSENMTSLQESTNEEIKGKVDQINSISAKITTLNKQINIIELKGTTANELRDQRNLLVDELSSVVNVEVSESPIYNANDPDNPTGANLYVVNIAGGANLVNGYKYEELECVSRAVGDKVNQSDAEGLYDIFWKDTGMQLSVTGDNLSGELKALFDMRDGNNDEYFHGKISGFVPQDNTNASNPIPSTVTIATTAEYLEDTTKTTLNGTGTIVLNNAEYKYTSWKHNSDGTYTFTLALDDNQDNQTSMISGMTADQKPARIGSGVSYQGIPYYMSQMNEWVRNFASVFNKIECSGQDLYGNSLAGDAANNVDPTSFFVAKNVTDSDNEYNFGQSTSVSSTSDSYYQLTAATFSVSKVMTADAGRMSTTATLGSINKDSSDIVDLLEKIKDDKSTMSFRGCSSSEFLQCVLSDMALNANTANNFRDNCENISGAITNQKLSISGVDEDEEAIDLVKFQSAYNLSSKMIQVMTEIYDRLILQTGV